VRELVRLTLLIIIIFPIVTVPALGVDYDHDQLPTYVEIFTYHTNPFSNDTDRDGLPDGYEVKIGTNPLQNWKYTFSID
jgi:hypothetical protein